MDCVETWNELRPLNGVVFRKREINNNFKLLILETDGHRRR